MVYLNDNIYKNQELKLINRNSLYLTGVKKIINLESDEFIVDSVYGKLIIKGNDLEVTVIDIDKGDLKLKGTIDSIVYSNIKSKNKESIITKLFKWLVQTFNCLVG